MARRVPRLARARDSHHRPHAGTRRPGAPLSDRLPRCGGDGGRAPGPVAGDGLCLHPQGKRVHGRRPLSQGRARPDADHAPHWPRPHAGKMASGSRGTVSSSHPSSMSISAPITYAPCSRRADRASSWRQLPTTPVRTGSGAGSPRTESSKPRCGIDNIPFTETRRYVRRLLAYIAIYEHRLGQEPTRLSERMPPVPARRQHLKAYRRVKNPSIHRRHA